MPVKALELLAPAKNLETALIALNSGADAVYMGAPKFGARSAAGNPIEDIERACRHAHFFNSRVYVTLNTVLFDHELEEARQLIRQIYEAGADALIIQDMGILEMDLPPIPLYASTQCDNRTPEGVKFLEKAGFQRVILARELTLEEIRAIRAETSVELESFVHGALCVSYSGRCYMSYAAGGRSANRGECAQPCRMKYTLSDPEGKAVGSPRHWLCLKDLNRSESLEELADAGITSFKIEGRLKDKYYVRNIVSLYRRKLDAIQEERKLPKASSGKIFSNFVPKASRSFNRGFTNYFLHGPDTPMASLYTQKSIGEPIGRVGKIFGASFEIEPFENDEASSLHTGDGICYIGPDGELAGGFVEGVEGNRITPKDVRFLRPGMEIFRNQDRLFEKTLEQEASERRIGLTIRLAETEPGKWMVEARDSDGNTAETVLDHTPEPSKNETAQRATLEKQFGRLGETFFYLENFTLEGPFVPFLPASEINQLRRSLSETLENKRNAAPRKNTRTIVKTSHPYPLDRLSYQHNVTNALAARFYERHGVLEIEPGMETGASTEGKPLMTTRFCILQEIGRCIRENGGKPGTYILKDRDKRFQVRFLCGKCGMEIKSV